MAENVQKDFYILPNDTPVVPLDCTEAFENLNDQEKKYAHRIGKACAEGSIISFFQVSAESPAMFAILHQIFTHETAEEVKSRALASGWNEDEFTAFLVYAASFLANCGNYKSFGDTKFIPNVDQTKLTKLFEGSEAFSKNSKLQNAWKTIEDRIFSLDPKHLGLNFGNAGVTTYLSPNITVDDTNLVDKFFKSKHMEAWNSRLFKAEENGKTVYTVRLGAIQDSKILEEEFEGVKIVVQAGDYSPLLANVNKELEKAVEFAANDNQKQMIQKYIEHFKSGSLDAHKDASRFWVKDCGPVVESYIGFIENYRDPAGTRAEFEGFVSCVNKETSKKFQTLVSRAEELLTRLPWGAEYEKDKFLKPDFTALEVVYFGGSGIPAGINIPNYDEIRQNEGFKNVSLGNVISAIPKQKVEFLSAEDEAMFKKYFKESFEVQVGLHELLGHGSGKLFQQDGEKLNFDKTKVKHLITGEPVTWYDKGETWSSKFGQLGNAYEECRAEAVGYYLCCYPDILQIFGFEGQVAEDVKYTNWLNEIRAGLVCLEFYQADTKKWGQAHSWARYVLLRVALAAGQGFVSIEECVDENGKPDLKFSLDRTKIDSVGKPAIGDFLKLLQVYKSTGDFAGGSKLFNEWGAVDSKAARWREIVISRRKPRRIFVQSNTVLTNDKVELKNYEATHAGVIQSFVERYQSVEEILNLWEKDAKIFGL
jgi:dipeptidyl-peptidase-3